MTSQLVTIAALIMTAVLGPALSAPAGSPAFGLWLTKNRDAKVRVADCGGGLCGTIAWLAEPIDRETGRPVTDKANPDPSRRGRPMVGVRIFGMEQTGTNKWTGVIYNAEDGKTYNGTIQMLGPNALKIEGCLGPFCDHEIWVRTN